MIQPCSGPRPTRWPATLVLAALIAAAGCAGPDPGFDAVRARGHIDTLAGTIGSRPHGSPAATLARNYVATQLESLGFTVRIQETDAVAPEDGLTAHVRNIIAWRDGELGDAIALVSHYDTRPEAAGAIDDGLGIAISLESARLLSDVTMRHSLFVIVTDAEEVGLMGARAAVSDPEVAQRVRAFLNFDGTGAAGPSMLFETTGGSPLEAWASGAVAPFGGSYAIEVYRRMPNDTDFTVFRTLGAAGLNFAAISDNYAYHTDRDVPGRLRTSTLRHATRNTVSTVVALDRLDLTASGAVPTYFDVARMRGVVYGPVVTLVVSVLACVLGVLAWVRVAAAGRKDARVVGLVLTVAAWLVIVMASGLGALGAAHLVIAVRPEVAPWYAAPAPFFAFLLTSGVLGGWAGARFVSLLPGRRQPVRPPLGVWFVALPVWIAATAASQAVAPVAAYLVAWPLAVTAIALLAARGSSTGTRVASGLSLGFAGLLWFEPTVRLFAYVVALFGWLPVVPPVWIYPALIATAALVIMPGAIGLLPGRRAPLFRPSRTLLVLGIPVVLSGLLSLMTPAYTVQRPNRRAALYVQNDVRGTARWEVSSHEREAGLADALASASWGEIGSVDAPGTRVTRLPGPFRAEAASRVLVSPDALPAVVRSEIVEQVDGGQRLIVTVVPRVLTSARLSLPQGLVPLASSLTGVVREGRWEASHAAVPSGGLTIRLDLGFVRRESLAGTVVLLSTSGLPGGTGPRALPAWLPDAATSWSATSVFVIPVVP